MLNLILTQLTPQFSTLVTSSRDI